MASQTALTARSLSAIEMAMLEELGVGRINALPMDGGEPSRPADLKVLKNRPPPQGDLANKWNTAIANGAFDDDDAIQVAGLENIADGQLARINRASRFANMVVTARYDDEHFRQRHNGQIHPRAMFHREKRGPSKIGLAHQGDGLVHIPGKPLNIRNAPATADIDGYTANTSVSHTARRGPAPPGLGGRPANANVSFTAHGARRPQPSRPQPVSQPPVAAQKAAVQVQNPPPQAQRQRFEDARLILPDGASIVFQTPAELASPSFKDRNVKFPGIVYFVAGSDPSDDQIILRVDDERVEDVKCPRKEYASLVTQAREVILQFKTSIGRITWYVIKFNQRDDMVAFVEALRNFVDRPNQTQRVSSTTVAISGQGAIGAIEPATVSAPSQAKVPGATVAPSFAAPADVSNVGEALSTLSITVHPSQPAQSTEPLTSVQTHAGHTVIESSQEQDAATTVGADIVEDMVSWTIEILACIRETGPVEMTSFDALPGIIRGTAAAVLLKRQPSFSKLDHQQRVAYIDKHYSARVVETLKRRLRGQAAQDQPARPVKTTASQGQPFQEAQASTSSIDRGITYTGEELMRLRSAAIPPPYWLPELDFFKKAARSSRHGAAGSLHGDCAPGSLPSSLPSRDEIIGLFVANTTSEAQVRALFAAEDQAKIVRVLNWSPVSNVVTFKTTEDRDGALQRVADEWKTQSQGYRQTPLVEVFQRRKRRGTTSTTRSASDMGSSQGGHQSHSTSGRPSRPAIIVTAPSRQDSATAASQADDDINGLDSKAPPTSAPGGHSGLNSSRFNPDNTDLLGEISGSWTGVLTKTPSYMDDLTNLL